MKVIVNSDIFFHGSLIRDSLGTEPQRLLDACRSGGHTLVLPRTALLELERMQAAAREAEIKRLRDAYSTLERHGVMCEKKAPEELIKAPDLLALMRKTGAKVEVADPTIEDFTDAERRACLHLPPQDPDTKSDEMRDLVIWAIAVRLARAEKSALLVSRDKVHSGELGAEEARAANLARESSIDGALRALAVGTPTGEQVLEVLRAGWPSLQKELAQLGDAPEIKHVDSARFERDEEGGVASLSCSIRLGTKTGDIAGRLVARLQAGTLKGLDLDGLTSGGIELNAVSVKPDAQVQLPRADPKAQQEALKDILGSDK